MRRRNGEASEADPGGRDGSDVRWAGSKRGGRGGAWSVGEARGLGENPARCRGLCHQARQRRAAPLRRVVAATAGSGRALGSRVAFEPVLTVVPCPKRFWGCR